MICQMYLLIDSFSFSKLALLLQLARSRGCGNNRGRKKTKDGIAHFFHLFKEAHVQKFIGLTIMNQDISWMPLCNR